MKASVFILFMVLLRNFIIGQCLDDFEKQIEISNSKKPVNGCVSQQTYTQDIHPCDISDPTPYEVCMCNYDKALKAWQIEHDRLLDLKREYWKKNGDIQKEIRSKISKASSLPNNEAIVLLQQAKSSAESLADCPDLKKEETITNINNLIEKSKERVEDANSKTNNNANNLANQDYGNKNNSSYNTQSNYKPSTGNSNNSANLGSNSSYLTEEEYKQYQQNQANEKYEKEKNDLVDKAMSEMERTNREYDTRQTALDEGFKEFEQGISSGDRYSRTGSLVKAAATILPALGADLATSLGGTLLVGVISATSKTAEEREAEENQRLFNEYLIQVKYADSLLLIAEKKDEYSYSSYKAARNEYERVLNHKFAADYPSSMINKIDYLFETERIKAVMIDFSEDFSNDLDKNYFSQSGEAIYFYFATIEMDPKNRVSYLKISNIFPVYYDQVNQRWPYLPEIKKKIAIKYPNAILKGFFRSKTDAVSKRDISIQEAKKNYFISKTDYYTFSFNTKQEFEGGNSNTDFWGNENNNSNSNNKSQNTDNDFWGNTNQTKTDTVKVNNKVPVKVEKKEEVDFWGNPIKK